MLLTFQHDSTNKVLKLPLVSLLVELLTNFSGDPICAELYAGLKKFFNYSPMEKSRVFFANFGPDGTEYYDQIMIPDPILGNNNKLLSKRKKVQDLLQLLLVS